MSTVNFYSGAYRGVFDSLDGEVEVELALYPEAGTFDYRDGRLGRVQGRFNEISADESGEWALLELRRGREKTRLLVREAGPGIELRPMQSVREQLELLPMAGRLELTPAG